MKFCLVAMMVLLFFSAFLIGLSSNSEVALAKTNDTFTDAVSDLRANEMRTMNATTMQVAESNYAGYAAIRQTQNDFTDAWGEWVVPDITGSAVKSAVDIWVGIGGAAPVGGAIIQVGTELMRDTSGSYHYRSWYENYDPAAPPGTTPPVYDGDVTPGHSFSAAVWQVDANHWHVQLTDTTTDKTIIDTDVDTSAHPPNQRSAEQITESHFSTDPAKSWDLPNFGTITYTNCKYSVGGGASQPINTYNPQSRNIYHNSIQRSTTSDISANGKSFSVAYLSTIVGGIVISVDKLGLLAPYIGVASTILVATVATAVYIKHVKRRKEKQ
jgi:hypothetical protein